MVTRCAEFSTSAAAASEVSSGRMTDAAARTGTAFAPDGTSAKNTPPGMTTTLTPPRDSAVRIAISSTRGICSGSLTSSQ
jgi:hypothetical protein